MQATCQWTTAGQRAPHGRLVEEECPQLGPAGPEGRAGALIEGKALPSGATREYRADSCRVGIVAVRPRTWTGRRWDVRAHLCELVSQYGGAPRSVEVTPGIRKLLRADKVAAQMCARTSTGSRRGRYDTRARATRRPRARSTGKYAAGKWQREVAGGLPSRHAQARLAAPPSYRHLSDLWAISFAMARKVHQRASLAGKRCQMRIPSIY
ncbi:uncharacterized protein V1510DRAFT_270227 [Dipodascopsis tothii]|uniref:uncharacterized protein n=1 Tax=Dipodascopsis tothii TaxID=44089 RepID=UPI0034CF2226